MLRSDVNSYYASINHTLLLKQLAAMIDDQGVLDLVALVLQRLDDVGDELFTVEKGITKGCPLSPLLGAVYLAALDEALAGYAKPRGLCYVRFNLETSVEPRVRCLFACSWQGTMRRNSELFQRVVTALRVRKQVHYTG